MQTSGNTRSFTNPLATIFTLGILVCSGFSPASSQTSPPTVSVSVPATQKLARDISALGIKVITSSNGVNYFSADLGYTILFQAIDNRTNEFWITLPAMKTSQLTPERMSSSLEWNDLHIPAFSIGHASNGDPHFTLTVYFSSPPRKIINEIAYLQKAANGSRSIWDAGAGN